MARFSRRRLRALSADAKQPCRANRSVSRRRFSTMRRSRSSGARFFGRKEPQPRSCRSSANASGSFFFHCSPRVQRASRGVACGAIARGEFGERRKGSDRRLTPPELVTASAQPPARRRRRSSRRGGGRWPGTAPRLTARRRSRRRRRRCSGSSAPPPSGIAGSCSATGRWR